MEELIERVSAIWDSPILQYNKQKFYRQKFILLLVYLIYLVNFPLLAAEKNNYDFESYKNNVNGKINIMNKSGNAGKKYYTSRDNMKYLNNSAEAMKEVESLFDKLEISIKELAEAKPIQEEDEHAILKAFGKIDGILTYTHEQLEKGKNQLLTIQPQNEEESVIYNSLMVRFMSFMKLANELKLIIAEKHAAASKKEK